MSGAISCRGGNSGVDGPIRANRFADSYESLDSRESSQGSRTEPLFCESHFGGLTIANCRFEAIRANRLHVIKIGFFSAIDSHESARFVLRIAGPSRNSGDISGDNFDEGNGESKLC